MTNPQDKYIGGVMVLLLILSCLWFGLASMYQTFQSLVWVWRWVTGS